MWLLAIRSLRMVSAVSLLVLALGCGELGPKTYPVSGKVAFKGGAGPLNRLVGGRVRFQSTADATVTPEGVIDEDGSFTMNTFAQGRALRGVPAGEYKARVDPPPSDERNPQPTPILPKYKDFNASGLTFTVPVAGQISIEVERPKR